MALDTLIESYMDNLFAIVDANLNTEKLKEAFVFNLSEETHRPMIVDHSAIIKQIINLILEPDKSNLGLDTPPVQYSIGQNLQEWHVKLEWKWITSC